MLFNGNAETARAIGADGLHLNSRSCATRHARWVPHICSLRPVAQRILRRRPRWGRLCVVVAGAAKRAVIRMPSRSAGTVRRPLSDAASMPVYALGGMRPELLDTAWRHGAQGVAGIRGLWGDDAAG